MKKRTLVSNVSKIKCGDLDEVMIVYCSIDEIEKINDRPGWYCWIYVPEAPSSLNMGFVKQQYLYSQVKANLGINYSGKLKNLSEYNIPEDVESYFDELKKTMLAFGPALYIGKANKLCTRLSRHKSQLDQYLISKIDDFKKDSSFEIDSPEESSFFASRVGKYMDQFNIDRNSLYVKCIYATNGNYLLEVEGILNHSFFPTYGRR